MLYFYKEKNKCSSFACYSVAGYNILPPGGDNLIRSYLFMYRDSGRNFIISNCYSKWNNQWKWTWIKLLNSGIYFVLTANINTYRLQNLIKNILKISDFILKIQNIQKFIIKPQQQSLNWRTSSNAILQHYIVSPEGGCVYVI